MATTVFHSRVIQQEIGDVLKGSPFGITTSDLSSIQNCYQGVEITFGSFDSRNLDEVMPAYLSRYRFRDHQPVDYKFLAVKKIIRGLFVSPFDQEKVHMTSPYDSRVLLEIEEILKGSLWVIAMSDLSRIERCYQLRHHKSLDYKSLGVENIQDLIFKLAEQKKVLLLKKPESKETYVMSVSMAELKQRGYLKILVKELLKEYCGEITFRSFPDFYEDKFKVRWNSYDYGLTGLDQLCDVLKDIVMVEVGSFSGEKVMKAVNKDSSGQAAVTMEIEDILEKYPWGIAMCDLPCIEEDYQLRHGKSLDYDSFGVGNIWELFVKLGEQKEVLLLKEPNSKQTYVMSVSVAEYIQKGYLKNIVKELLAKNGGEIAFGSFEDFYKDKCKLEWISFDFGLTDFDKFCRVLRDIAVVEVNSSGKKVMKAVIKDSSGPVAVTREIEKILERCRRGIAMSKLSQIEDDYRIRHRKPLDYGSFGDIEGVFAELGKQKKVLWLAKPKSEETRVMSVRVAENVQKGYLKYIIKELLDEHGGEIGFGSFKCMYKDKCKLEWNSHEFGLIDLDELCHVLKDIVMVEVLSSGEKVMRLVNNENTSRQAVVIREIEEILKSCPWGIAMSDLSCVESSYQLIYGKSLDYKSFGVENIKDLFVELYKQKKVVLLDRTESEDRYVMCFWLAESQHKDKLKSIVETLLRENGGEILLSCFEECYWDMFEVEWNPADYGLNDFNRFCYVLKDILMVEVNSSGEEVIKAVNKDSRGDKGGQQRFLRTGGLQFKMKKEDK